MSGRQPINGNNTLNRTPRGNGGGGAINKDFTIYGSNTILDPLGVNFNINETIFVDANYGNNTTAEKYQPLKAYKSIQAAVNSSVAGEVIYVRKGVYSEQILLKDGITLYFEMGCILKEIGNFTQIFKLDSQFINFSVNILGYAKIEYNGFYEPFYFRGLTIDINIHIYSMNFSRQGIAMTPKADNSKLNITSIKDIIQDVSYTNFSPSRFMNVQGTLSTHNDNWNINWGGIFTAQYIFSFGAAQNVTIVTRGEFQAIANVSSLSIVNYQNGTHIHYGSVKSLLPYTADPYGINSFSGLISQEQGNKEVHGNIYSVGQPCFRPVFANGKVKIFNSEIHAENVIPIFNRPTANGNSDTYFYNCQISDGTGNISDNVIRMEDDITAAGDINHLWFYGCKIEKESSFVGTGGVIYKNQDDTLSRLFMFSSVVLCAANQTLTETDVIANGNFYFSETHTNKALGVNTANVGGSLYENKTYLL